MSARFRLAVFALLIPTLAIADEFSPTKDPISPAGVRAVVDLPASQQMKNTGGMGRRGPGTGAGLCVFTSLQHAARWANLVDMEGFRRWMESKPGGGYPQKVDQMLAAWCKEKGIPIPPYVQHTGGDDSFLDLAIRTGRCPCVTYAGEDGFYPGQVAHMVNLAHIDSDRAAIIDNNRPGKWIWMTREDFLVRWRAMSGGWAVVFLDPPPPPYPSAPSSPQAKAFQCGCCGEPCSECGPCACPKRMVFGQCANGRCQSANSSAVPIGSPPSNGHEWGWVEGFGYCWRIKPEPTVARGDGDTLPTGVVSERIHEHPEYSITGRQSTREEVYALLSSALDDDSDHWHLAAVGDSAFLKRFKADVDQLPAETKAKLLVQGYTPTAWQVAQFKLPAAGVVLRKPAAGRVSSDVGSIAAAEYSSDRLASLLGEPSGPTPKPRPIPAPRPEPTPSPTPATPSAQPFSIPIEWAAAAGLTLILARRRK